MIQVGHLVFDDHPSPRRQNFSSPEIITLPTLTQTLPLPYAIFRRKNKRGPGNRVNGVHFVVNNTKRGLKEY